MRSSFSSGVRRSGSVSSKSRLVPDETYNLSGLNLIAPDQVMPDGQSPFLTNTRRYAADEAESSVAQRTRKGSARLSVAIGETQNVNVATASTGDITIDPATNVGAIFTATAAGVLTRVTLNLKKTANARGFLIVKISATSNNLPTPTVIAQSSISPSLIGSAYSAVSAYFIDAPDISAGTKYFVSVEMRDLGAGAYYLSKTGTTGGFTSLDGGQNWIMQGYGANFSTYLSTSGKILGWTKRYPKNTPSRTLFGFGTGIYQMADSPAAPTLIETYTSATADWVRFTNVDENTFWWDGVSPARQWVGTTAASTPVTNIPSANGVPINMIVHENRLMVVPKNDPTRVDFSALYDFTSWPSTNFFYIGRPNSPDAITGWTPFQQGLTFFTKRSKTTLTGTDITTFAPVPHRGTKGAISQEAIALGKSLVYFMSDDKHIYSWNGTDDVDISLAIVPELKKILDIKKVRLHLFNNQLRVYYNRNPDSNVTYMLLYDINDGQWYRDTGRPVAGSMEWEFDDHQLIEFSSRAGWLFTGEQGYSDLGKAISWKYWTNYKAYGSGAAKDRIKRFRPVVRPADSAYNMQVGKDVDFRGTPVMRPWLVDSSGTKWGTFNWGDGTTYGSSEIVDNAAPMSGRGKFTQFRFEHDCIEDPVQLLGYIALVKQGTPR